MTVGERIREARKAAGMTGKELAEETGLYVASVYGYEANRNDPSLFAILCIADALGVSIDFLTGRDTSNDGKTLENLARENNELKEKLKKIQRITEE